MQNCPHHRLCPTPAPSASPAIGRRPGARLAAPALVAIAAVIPAAGPLRAAEIMAPSSTALTQTVLTLPAATDTVLGSNDSRRYLCVMNIGTDLVTLGFDAPAVSGSGWAVEAPATAGHQGGSMCWEGSTVAGNAVHGVSTNGSTVVVLEGR